MKQLSLLLAIVLFWSCAKTSRPEPPVNLLSKDLMADVLYEMFIINSAKGSSMKILQQNGIDPDTYVLRKYEIDSASFVDSNNYYAYDFDAYRDIMNAIQERVEREKETYEAQLEQEQEAAKKRADSIKKLMPKKEVKLDKVKKDEKKKTKS